VINSFAFFYRPSILTLEFDLLNARKFLNNKMATKYFFNMFKEFGYAFLFLLMFAGLTRTSMHPDLPLTQKQVDDKFRLCATDVLGVDKTESALNDLRNLEKLSSIKDLMHSVS
jgi:hypothetical protein